MLVIIFFLFSLSVSMNIYTWHKYMTIFNISFWICSHFCIALTFDTVDSPTWPCKAFWEDAFSSALIWKWMWHLMNHLMNLTLVTLVCVYMNCHTESTVCVCVCVGENGHFFNTLFHKQPFLCVFISARAQVSDTRRSPSLRLYKQKD